MSVSPVSPTLREYMIFTHPFNKFFLFKNAYHCFSGECNLLNPSSRHDVCENEKGAENAGSLAYVVLHLGYTSSNKEAQIIPNPVTPQVEELLSLW